jgi:hypothetical protein
MGHRRISSSSIRGRAWSVSGSRSQSVFIGGERHAGEMEAVPDDLTGCAGKSMR